MTSYEILPNEAGIAIRISGVCERQEELLAAFGECQQGECSCPTTEYRKVQAMDVIPGQDEIAIELQAKPGTCFEPEQIAACLDYTVAQGDR